ncbi:MAG: hypothetical protein HY924_14310 [Elusimicrobia bacterium]|nr:hypothetical protein [Elusimicrobiota bacterium]
MENEDLAKESQTQTQDGAPAQAAAPAPAPAPQPEVPTQQPVEPEPQPAPVSPEPAAPAPSGLQLEDIKPGELLKNLKDENIYKVTGLSGRKVLVRDLLAAERVFLYVGQFERPSEDEAGEFDLKRVKPAEPKVSKVAPELAKKELDAFASLLEAVRQNPGSDADKFAAFWKQALEVFGDDPTMTWRMRANKGLQPSPTLRLRSSKTHRWRDAVMLWAMEKVTIIVSKEVCPETDREACRALFPDDNEAYGKAISVTIPYRDLDEAKVKTYLDCFRLIVKAFSA